MNYAETQTWIQEKIEGALARETERMTGAMHRFGKPFSLALAIYKKQPLIPEKITEEAWKVYINYQDENKDALEAVEAFHAYERYEETKNAQLMYCNKKYVVTNEKLRNPAGFNISDRVFIQTKIAIHMDEQPTIENTPDWVGRAYFYNIDELARVDSTPIDKLMGE